MEIHIFVTNISNDRDILQLSTCLDLHAEIQNWNVDLTDDEKVLRIVTSNPVRNDFIALVESCGFACSPMDW
ncbi:hypothetical protein ACSBL2_15245 [Pedobacter sp. AW31-3R]|uniref:hypothetical protein n=1 Tax=Pedobacter sp. AW31-3R TaxID=3445781 RepID=UPI003FA0DA4E